MFRFRHQLSKSYLYSFSYSSLLNKYSYSLLFYRYYCKSFTFEDEKVKKKQIYNFCKNGDIDSALDIVNSMPKSNLKNNSYPYIINTAYQQGKYKLGIEIFNNLLEKNIIPLVKSCNLVISCYCKLGEFDNALQVINAMNELEVHADTSTFNILLSFLGKQNTLDALDYLYNEMIKRLVDPDPTTYAILIHSYCTHNNISEALKIFKKAEIEQKLYYGSYSSLIHYYIKHDMHEEISKLLLKLREKDEEIPTEIYTSLIISFSKDNQMEHAKVLFEELKRRKTLDCTAYTSIITGYCNNKEYSKVLELYKTMKKENINRDLVLYYIVLKSIIQDNNLNELTLILDDMENDKILLNSSQLSYFLDILIKKDINLSLLFYKKMINMNVYPDNKFLIYVHDTIIYLLKNKNNNSINKEYIINKYSEIKSHRFMMTVLQRLNNTQIIYQYYKIFQNHNSLFSKDYEDIICSLGASKSFFPLYNIAIDIMKNNTIKLEPICYTHLLKAIHKQRNHNIIYELYEYMKKQKTNIKLIHYTILLEILAFKKQTEKVQILLDEMKNNNIKIDNYLLNILKRNSIQYKQ